MRFLEPDSDTRELEKGLKNKWRWDWLKEKDSFGNEWGKWLKKPDVSGSCFCEPCGKTIIYKTSGKKAVKQHSNDKKHKANIETVRTNQVLPGSSKATEARIESMQDRIAKQRALTAAFISEHCLPFSLAEDLLNFAKRLSDDKKALDKTTISRTSATYINTHGLAQCFKDELKKKLQHQMLSLNIDEATNNNNDKVLNIIVQYYDSVQEKIVIEHLGSRKQNVATAKDILLSIESVLQEYDIQWSQIVSVLMDNCSTMRGVRGGVETLIREKNPTLLDISGDTVHMINNVAKVLLKHVDQTIQNICSDIYYDIEESPKVKEIFREVQSLMNSKTTKQLIRPISSRFLQMLDVSTRAVECLDYLTVYYAGFLTDQEKKKYSALIDQIFKQNGVSEEAQAAVTLIQMSQDQQQKSTTSQDRKDRILSALFLHRTETVTKLNLFRGLLSVFQGYVKKFQTESPQIHVLHRYMIDITQEVLAMFIKPEYIPDSVRELLRLDVTDRSLHKSDKELSVGKFAFVDLNKSRVDKAQHHWVSSLYKDLRTGYVMAASKLLQLPLNNKTLRRMSVLDPDLANHYQASLGFKALAGSLPNVISVEEAGEFAMEVNSYTVDRQVKELVDRYMEGQRIVEYFWTRVFKLRTFDRLRYPLLTKLVKALLSVFSGPLIESTFNIMDDIVEKDRTKLTMKNYEAVAIVKTALKARNVKAIDLKINTQMKQSCINAYDTYQKHLHNYEKRSERATKTKKT